MGIEFNSDKTFYFSDKDITIDLSRAKLLYRSIKAGSFDYLIYMADCKDFVRLFEELGFHKLDYKDKQ